MSDFFSSGQPILTARAPGRMDIMGGISDYSGSLLLQMPVKQTTIVQVQERTDSIIQLRSLIGKSKSQNFSIDSGLLVGKNYAEASAFIHSQPGGDWANYILGCMMVLHIEKNLPFTGMNVLIVSTVPMGKGVSSSASLEVATMCALEKLYKIKLGDTELPLLAQKAENLMVGAPCGLMDQLSSYLGHKSKLLPLICQPHKVFPPISIPSGVSFCGIDSGIRHAVSGASYSDVRTAAFMAYTIIAMQEGSSVHDLQQAKNSGHWESLPYKGFLANVPPSVFDTRFRDKLPEEISGKDFLEKYNISLDTVTQINPDNIYKLRACALHPVQENYRIHLFNNLLKIFSAHKDKKETMQLLGELMFQSHAGYTAVGLGNKNTDEIVERVLHAGPAKNVYGARVTGGGSGGTVAILCYGKEGKQTARKIFEEYREYHHIKSFFFAGSSNGAKMLNAE